MIGDNIHDFINSTILGTFLQLARVDVVTGKYEYFKRDPELENDFKDIDDIYDYMKKLASEEYVYPEFREEYLRFSDPEYVCKRAFGGEKMIVYRYKRKTSAGGRWVTFCIIIPKGCSPEKPWVVFGLRDSDTDTTALADAMSALSNIYHKILKIDLTKDTFDIVKADDDELPDSSVTKITEWLSSFAEEGNVHEEDINVYREFIETEHIKEHFRNKRTRLSCRYRRKSAGGGFRWAQMDLIPNMDYSNDNIVLMLFVKDVHEEHMAELRHRQELVDNYNRDTLTLLYNRHKFNEDTKSIKRSAPSCVTCLYMDVNGLHELNNHLGHQKGDDMLCCVADTLKKYFPDDRSYRIGGDEFVTLSASLSQDAVERVVERMKDSLSKNNYDISAGIESGSGNNIYNIIGAAELAMRKDKEAYYTNGLHDRRKRGMNEELEQLLTEKRDAEYFLRLIATRYAGVYFVDIEKDSLRYIYIPEYFKKLLQRTSFSFSAAMNVYAENYVRQDYYKRFKEVTDLKTLPERLNSGNAICLDYIKVDGTDMELKILKMNKSVEGKYETIWIFTGGNDDPDDI